jgi:hypothetical protein
MRLAGQVLIGTRTERLGLALGAASEGWEFFETNNGSCWRVVSGAWVPVPTRIGDLSPVAAGGSAGFGTKLRFSGGDSLGTWDSDNSDELFAVRYNRASDETSLALGVGDGDAGPAGVGVAVDLLEIGHETGGGTWYPRFAVTGIGGFCVRLINRTGGASTKGRLVTPDTTPNNDSVILTGAGDVECIGAFLEGGVANGSWAWICTGGIVEVLLDTNTGTTVGNWVMTGAAGYADGTNAAPVPATHWQEIGHAVETVAAGGPGTNVLARILMHFL